MTQRIIGEQQISPNWSTISTGIAICPIQKIRGSFEYANSIVNSIPLILSNDTLTFITSQIISRKVITKSSWYFKSYIRYSYLLGNSDIVAISLQDIDYLGFYVRERDIWNPV